MPIKDTKLKATIFGEFVTVNYRYQDYLNSPRVGKKLMLKQNRYTSRYGKMLSTSGVPPYTLQVYGCDLSRLQYCPGLASAISGVNNELYAKAQGKLRKESASLGVTFASKAEAARMITKRFGQVSRTLEIVYKRLRSNPKKLKRLRRTKEPLAGQVLELEFGWFPLLDDIRKSLSVFTNIYPPAFIRVTAKRDIPDGKIVYQDDSNGKHIHTFTTVGVRGSYAFQCSVSNPNLWLANYLGLLNVPGIAWDLVPWSFVVNFFSNTGSIVNSLTDSVGLSFTEQSVTIKRYGVVNTTMSSSYFRNLQKQSWYESELSRTVGVPPALSWEFRLPKHVGFETMLIAGSLLTQRLIKLNKLLSF